MTVFNLGSINIDLFYQVPHFPAAGETLTTLGHARMLGGKGANQSITLARAGMDVLHIGASSAEDSWLRKELEAAGVNIAHIQDSDRASGHAIVSVDPEGENQILLAPGANRDIDMDNACAALDLAQDGDWALLQNETNGADRFVAEARAKGLKLAYSAAPFDADVVLGLLPHTDLLVVNEGEAAALGAAIGKPVETAGLPHLVITLGGAGATYHGIDGDIKQPAFAVEVVDTTGAGDCYLGYLLAGMAAGRPTERCMAEAAAAAAIHVTRPGTGAAIPTRAEVDAFLEKTG